MNADDGRQRRIVIAGGGVAGLEIATTLARRWRRQRRRDPATPTITLLDRDSAHVWKPMLHTIAAGTRDISQQQTTYVAQAAMPASPTSRGSCAAWIAPTARC